LRGIKVDKDKQSRAMPWAARAEAGAVRIVAGSWVKDFIDEVVAFPSAPHDDYVDAASGAVAMVARPAVKWGFS
jgi:predicted phage terminase large subunit-like protein